MEGKKFVGGAEIARKRARMATKRGNPIVMPFDPNASRNNRNNDTSSNNNTSNDKHTYQHQRNKDLRLPRNLSPSKMFYGSLLLSHVQEYALVTNETKNSTGKGEGEGEGTTNNSDNAAAAEGSVLAYRQLMGDICDRACLRFPETLVASYYRQKEFYTQRASLVLEEARCMLSEELRRTRYCGSTHKKQNKKKDKHNSNLNLHLNLSNNKSKNNHCYWNMTLVSVAYSPTKIGAILTFQKQAPHTTTNNDSQSFNSTFSPLQFTPKEQFHMKPGCIFEIIIPHHSHYPNNDHYHQPYSNNSNAAPSLPPPPQSILACIEPNPGFGNDPMASFYLTLHVFHINAIPYNLLFPGTSFPILPLLSLISQQRQFEICWRGPKVDFLPTILGIQESTHLRFDDDNDNHHDDHYNNDGNQHHHHHNQDNHTAAKYNTDNIQTYMHVMQLEDFVPFESNTKLTTSQTLIEPPFSWPQLNQTQAKAASSFLQSPPSTLTLVQGPPGTGKTTFLVSVLLQSFYRCLPSNHQHYNKNYNPVSINTDRRILVTAPTNKAITVLASRFLDILHKHTTLNVVLIGVEDKLVGDEQDNESNSYSTNNNTKQNNDDFFSVQSLSLSLRNIYVYTWLEEIISSIQSLQFTTSNLMIKYSSPSQPSAIKQEIKNVLVILKHLLRKIERSIPNLAKQKNTLQHGTNVMALLQSIILKDEEMNNDNSSKTNHDSHNIFPQVDTHFYAILSSLQNMDSYSVVQELLATANVIFCTLTTSGVSVMKRTKKVDDLFVDEAAAATEPEICIPFQFQPKRMLIVGDPKQLPATVISQRAMQWGLDKSLMDRLMFRCGKKFTMLDVQYRMKPDIRSFPSKRFYEGKIIDGQNVLSKKYRGEVKLFGGREYSFINIVGKEAQSHFGSYFNLEEAQEVVKIVIKAKHASKVHDKQNDTKIDWKSKDKLRIITFYQGQVKCIKNLLQKVGLGQIMVATVDSSQGCEADIVIISFVRSNTREGSSRRTAGFLTDDRRINVALTRAKYQTICIGDAFGTLHASRDETLVSLIDDAKNRNLIFDSNTATKR